MADFEDFIKRNNKRKILDLVEGTREITSSNLRKCQILVLNSDMTFTNASKALELFKLQYDQSS